MLNILICPLCHGNIAIKEAYNETMESLLYGTLHCDCTTYPVCEGIPILTHSSRGKYILYFLGKGAFQKAVLVAMANYADDLSRLLDFMESSNVMALAQRVFLKAMIGYFHRRYGNLLNNNGSFMEVLGNSAYDQYLRHRFSCQTFWSLYPFLPLISAKGGMVLEICCGAGHASSVLSRSIPAQKLIGIDGNFRNLYLAAKYLSSADFIQADVNEGLPFKDQQFSVAFMMDSFHYVDAQALLAKELVRVTKTDGFNLLLHLHNALKGNMSAGRPLSPDAIHRIFSGDDIRLLPEQDVINDFMTKCRLDLTRRYPESLIREADSLIVARKISEICLTDLRRELFRADGLIINPLYRMEDRDGQIVLNREFPSDAFRREYPLTEALLPERYQIAKELLKECWDQPPEELLDMRRRFLLLPVPVRYGGKNPRDL